MKRFFFISCVLFISFIGFYPNSLSRENLKCVYCGRFIKPGMKFLKTSDDKLFCSQPCYEKTLPKCFECGKVLSGRYLEGGNGKLYCSEKCISTIWPTCASCSKKFPKGTIISSANGELFFCEDCAKLPKCFCCGLPAEKYKKIEDGRHVCAACSKDAITNIDDAVKLIGEVRVLLAEKLSLKTDHQIEYELVDQETLERISPRSQHGLEFGLYRYVEETETNTISRGSKIIETTKNTKNYKIYMISHLSRKKFIEVAAHELAHDWMQEYYPKINNLIIKEGWAQYVAWRVNEIYGEDGLNKLIENNKNPVYGDGFRLIKNVAKRSNFFMDALHDFFKKQN